MKRNGRLGALGGGEKSLFDSIGGDSPNLAPFPWLEQVSLPDEKQEANDDGNTALWVGLGAVGVGALIWWASTRKK